VPPQPAVRDGEIETGLVLGRAAAFLEQERPVDLLDVDAAIPALRVDVAVATGFGRCSARPMVDELLRPSVTFSLRYRPCRVFDAR